MPANDNEISWVGNSVGMIRQGACECGQTYLILQPGRMAEIIKYMVAEGGPQAGETIDVFTTDHTSRKANCSRCGAEIKLPATELLDVDRDERGRWVQGVIDDAAQQS
jgi:hypothetical protein